MKKKILALTLLSLLATSCQATPITMYNFELTFDSKMGEVKSSVENGIHEEGTEITLTSICLEGFIFVGYFDKNTDEVVSSELNYTFNLVKDTFIEVKFSKEKSFDDAALGVLKGTFNGEEGTLKVDNKKVSLTGKELSFDLKINELKDEDLTFNEGRILYFGENNKYRLYLNSGEFKHLVLEEKINDSYQEVDSFMPTIEEFSGAYFMPLAEGDPYDPSYTSTFISNDYDSDRDLYLTSFSFMNNTHNNLNSFYFKSGFTIFEGNLTKTINLYDYADDYLMGSFVLGKEDNVGYLKPVSDEYSTFKVATAPFNVKYWNESDKLEFSLTDKPNETILDGKTYKISASSDEKGTLYTLTGETTRKFRASALGIEEIKDSGNVFYAVDGNEKYIDGEFTSGDYKVKIDLETSKLTLNGKETNFKYVLKEKRKAIEVTLDNKTYTFFAFKDDTSSNYVIRLVLDNKNHYLLNKDIYKSLFVGTHIYKGFTSKESIIIDDNLNFKFNDASKPVELEYEVKNDSAYIEFSDEDTTYNFHLEDESLGAFILSSDEEEKYFLPESQFAKFSGEYTSKINPDITFTNDKIKLSNKEYDYLVDLVFEPKTFANYVNITVNEGVTNSTFIIDSLGTIAEYKGVNNEGGLNYTSTYIKLSDAKSLIGRYSLVTKYGEENFEFKEDGTFYADQLSITGDALQENVKKEFTLSYSTYNGKTVPTINFEHKNMTIFLRKDGESLVTFDNYYSRDYIFRFNGYYKDTNHALRLYQNVLTLDGKDYPIESSEKVDTKTIITSGTTTFTFDKVEGVNNVNVKTLDEEFSLDASSFDPLLLKGASLTDNAITYIVQVNENLTTGIKEVLLSDGFMTYKGKYVIHEGKEALEFSLLFEKFYAYLDAGVPTLKKDAGSLPPVPPPPPPPPPPLPF